MKRYTYRCYLKSQQATTEKYFSVFCLVITLHVGIFFWVWQNQFGLVKTDQQEFISVSLRTAAQGNSAPKLLLQSEHTPQNKQPVSAHPSGREDGRAHSLNEVGELFGQSDDALARRSIFSNPQPQYPLASRRMREQGAVHLRLCIDHHGLVDHILLAKSSGYTNLDQSAIATVKKWRFATVKTTSTHTSDCYQLPIHFKLES
ncbi:MAG: hypothetical protein B7Y05_16410 [Polynucleobacter sp. 24-46-87]|nr:MAG: hypothetical protein B7Y55_04525 [Polynucleobacter sp. 35-46-207]OZA10712.1 MAG: hypothetical protein B7Y05_16410 [Polynucleobacter sp. 24-46-87]OZB47316.1 MAG: hypothetical protein B7X60_06445 [Polynucleobacter sp. 39-45-136]